MSTALNSLDDLTGKAFGLLSVISRAPNDIFGTVYWECRCRCNEIVVRRANTLRAGKFFTCGKTTCRFWSKVYIPETPDAECLSPLGWCHEWTAALHTGGYGLMKLPGLKRNVRAHVYALEQLVGPLASGTHALHRCDNRKCVRASHLFAGTHADNMADMASKGRGRKRTSPNLTQVERSALRHDVAAGLTREEIASKYQVTTRTVQRVWRSTQER